MLLKPAITTRLTPEEHFKIWFCLTVHRLIEQATAITGSREDTLQQFPFLEDYVNEIHQRGLETSDGLEQIVEQERSSTSHLPIRALRDRTGLPDAAVTLLMTTGLIEEDARFGACFELLQNMPGQHRPTAGLLTALFRDEADCAEVRANLRRLLELGLIQALNPDAARLEWALQPPTILWDALRGERPGKIANWARYRAPDELIDRPALILSGSTAASLASLPELLASGQVQCLVVRGPRHNGRRTLLGSIAKSLGRGTLEITGPVKSGDDRFRLIGSLATMLNAVPVIVLEIGPGETVDIAALDGYGGPIGLVLDKHGGVTGTAVERAITIALEVPDASCRRVHWRIGFEGAATVDAIDIAGRFRMTSGNIRRAAELARCYASINQHTAITLADVQSASRALNRQALETLAVHVPCSGSWEQIAASDDTLLELRNLESRCRYRESLKAAAGPSLGGSLNCGVRALFSGPSGTGKTMAARLLAASLGMDLYRLDLSAVINKYIGETEKNLNQVFARAEELDIILLLDEGDALLTNRTSVQNANDRYANLETNFLLQRMESFEGILVVTTNAANRIDSAFQRRMDVVVDFRLPDPNERWLIWQLHLAAAHEVDPRWLEEASSRCVLSGGQIRNAVLHASTLALGSATRVSAFHLEEGIRREYRKSGAVCPLRRRGSPTISR
jgi:ATPase family associated with various cellular activities (AAA)